MMQKPIILPYEGISPTLGRDVYIAPNAAVIGDVVLGNEVSVWFNVTIRGDVNYIRIGEHTNVQDNTCIHVSYQTHPTIIGKRVVIGHSVVLHGCTLEDNCLIGMGSCILDGAVVQSGAMLAAGSLLTPNKVVESGTLWAGRPARLVRMLNDDDKAMIDRLPDHYRRLAARYRGM